MPLRLASAGSRGNKIKNTFIRLGAFFVVIIIVFTCLTSFYNVSATGIFDVVDEETGKTAADLIMEIDENSTKQTATLFNIFNDYNIQTSVSELEDNDLSLLIKIEDILLYGINNVAEVDDYRSEYGTDNEFIADYLSDFEDTNNNYYLTGITQRLINNDDKLGDKYDNIQEVIDDAVQTYADYVPGTYYGIIAGPYGRYDDKSAYETTEKIIDYGANFDFEFSSGTTLEDIVDDTDDAFKALFVGAVASSYAGAMNAITKSTEETAALLTDALDGGYTKVGDLWAKGQEYMHDNDRSYQEYIIYNTAYDISTQVMLPIAGVILAFIFAHQIYEAVAERNNLNDMGGGYFIQLILRMIFLTAIVIFAWSLSEWFFGLGRWIVQQTEVIAEESIDSEGMMKSITNFVNDNSQYSRDEVLTWVLAYKICVNDAIDFGGTLVMLVQGLIINIGMYIVSIIIYVMVYVRLVEIYLYCCVSPVPLATMGSQTWRGTGINFVRSVFALALQGFIIYLCLTVFNVMISNTIENGLSGAEFTNSMWQVIGFSLVLVFCLFKSSSISKSVVNAM